MFHISLYKACMNNSIDTKEGKKKKTFSYAVPLQVASFLFAYVEHSQMNVR